MEILNEIVNSSVYDKSLSIWAPREIGCLAPVQKSKRHAPTSVYLGVGYVIKSSGFWVFRLGRRSNSTFGLLNSSHCRLQHVFHYFFAKSLDLRLTHITSTFSARPAAAALSRCKTGNIFARSMPSKGLWYPPLRSIDRRPEYPKEGAFLTQVIGFLNLPGCFVVVWVKVKQL